MSIEPTADEMPKRADQETGTSGAGASFVSHFSAGRGVLLALVGFEPFAFTVYCAMRALRNPSGTSNEVQEQVVFFVLGLIFTFVFSGLLSAVIAFVPTKRAAPEVNLGFEQGRVNTVLLLAAVGQGLAFFLCGLAMMDSPREPLYELGLRQMVWMVVLVLVAMAGVWWLLCPRKIPYVDYEKSEVAKHWRLGGMIYWNPDDPRYLVERRYGYGVTINWAFRGFGADRWPMLLAISVPLILMVIALGLLALFGGGGR